MPENPQRPAGGWFRPAGIDLGPRPPVRTPPLLPERAQAPLARGARFLVILALLAVVVVGVVVGLVAHPAATVAWIVGWAVVGLLVRIAWRASR